MTHFNAAPTVNTLLCADPNAARLEQPCHVTVAASPPSGHLFEQMTNLNLRPVHVYGMTETYGPITKGYILPEWEELPLKEKYARMARQGHGLVTSLPVRVVKLADEESEGAGRNREDAGALVDVAKDGKEIGEIVFFGNLCARGYYKDPEATKKLFAGGGLHSGDLAVCHPDGSIQILDRAKDIIISGTYVCAAREVCRLPCKHGPPQRKSSAEADGSAADAMILTNSAGGENISSVALESMLVKHPDVLEAGVVAVADSHWGERPKAYVTVRQGAEKKGLEGRDIVEWAKHQSQISKFMVPREVEVIDELPKTSTGKIRKNVLREWAKHGRQHGHE